MTLLLVLLAGLQVHEWGVITAFPVSMTGTPEAAVSFEVVQDAELEDRAPVLYFHGDPCTVTLRIDFPHMGYATQVLPEPDRGGVNSTYAVWEDIELTAPETDLSLHGWNTGPNEIPAPLWRNVNALDANHNGYLERFIYYECVPGSSGDLPFLRESGSTAMRMPYGEIPCIVLITSSGMPMYGVFTLADIIHSIPKGLRFLEDPAELRREVYRWAQGTLNDDEFQAFWNTWESTFLSDCTGDVVILYPVPEEILQDIASIEVVPQEDTQVQINRFVVAEVPYRTQ